jgi:hypothetical protein
MRRPWNLTVEFFMLEPVCKCGYGQRIFKKKFMSEICFVTVMKSVEVSTDIFKERNFLKVLNFKNLECSGNTAT